MAISLTCSQWGRGIRRANLDPGKRNRKTMGHLGSLHLGSLHFPNYVGTTGTSIKNQGEGSNARATRPRQRFFSGQAAWNKGRSRCAAEDFQDGRPRISGTCSTREPAIHAGKSPDAKAVTHTCDQLR